MNSFVIRLLLFAFAGGAIAMPVYSLGRFTKIKRRVAILLFIVSFLTMIATDILFSSNGKIPPHKELLEAVLIGVIMGSASLAGKHDTKSDGD